MPGIQLEYDREITITVGDNRRSINWQSQTLLLSEFYEKLKTPRKSTETMAEYLSLPKTEQDDRKDVGGFVAGSLSGTRRLAKAVIGRDLITLDLDHVPSGETDEVLRNVDGLGCGYCIYSTRKHTPETPRLRILLPFDRMATVDEYEAIARVMAAAIGIEFVDPTTFEASRMMYWPSCCTDGEYVFEYEGKEMIHVDDTLKAIDKEFGDWKDITKLPKVPGEEAARRPSATKKSNPLSKSGIVGAFCRVYDINDAIEKFLSDVYVPVEGTEDRYTYLAGSTTSGAKVYDDGLFLYSFHSTDPCCGTLVNAFDMVRIHKFGEADAQVKENTPVNRLPSYQKMCEFAREDPKVCKQLEAEKKEALASNYGYLTTSEDSSTLDWLDELEMNPQTGKIEQTTENILKIMRHDPELQGKFALNEFSAQWEVLGSLPWADGFVQRRAWSDNDNHGLYWFFETKYKITSYKKIDNALSLHNEEEKFNDLKKYLNSLQWDGVKRLDTLLIDYLGAKDSEYVKTVTRKAFTGAVKRAMEPGCKFDTMLILAGPQGIGKSTLLDRMSKGWFNDSIRTFEGKEASELLQGVWIVEIQELDAFRKTDVARIKQFVSLRHDRYRPAYGRHVVELPRCCAFFGTTNTDEFLRDRTGGRRFWPVDVGGGQTTKNIWQDLDGEIDQVWAEAVMRWRCSESLHLTGKIEEDAKDEQERHREAGHMEGIINDFVEKPVPKEWRWWPLDKRRSFLHGDIKYEGELVPRDRICAMEIWCEALNGQMKDCTNRITREYNEILRTMQGWVPANINFGYCGKQRGFRRTTGR